MLAVWAITILPALRNGGANGGRPARFCSISFIIAGTPPLRRAYVVGACLLQRQAHELAAALDGRPVVELVSHRSHLACLVVAPQQQPLLTAATSSRSIEIRSRPRCRARAPRWER